MTVVNNASNRRPRGPYALLGLVGLSAIFTYYLDSYLNEVTLDEESLSAVDMGGFTATEQQLARARQLGISKRVSFCVYDTNNHHCMHNDPYDLEHKLIKSAISLLSLFLNTSNHILIDPRHQGKRSLA